ncbi:MAG: hypothetical protein ACXWDI_07190 [Nocardioides sp.]
MTPEQEEQVRRMLASTPAEQGMPADVAARLDATLAGLVAERADPAPATVDELAERRRRRRWPRVLVAAATVSVVAYGVGVNLDGLSVSGGDADSTTAARDESFAEGGAGDAPATDEKGAEGFAPQPDTTTDSGAARDDVLLTGRTVRLRRDSLSADVQRLLPVAAALDRRARSPQEATGFLGRCSRPDTSRGDRLAAVRLDGKHATLVVRKAVDGTHVAQVYSCADPSRLLALTEVDSDR